MTKQADTPHRLGRALLLAALLVTGGVGAAGAQPVSAPPVGAAAATPDNAMLLTVFLKYDQARPLGELNEQLAKQGFYKASPPPGIEVVSWNVVMGIGQILVLPRSCNVVLVQSTSGMSNAVSTRRASMPV